MPKLYASHKNKKLIIDFKPGESIKDILDKTDLRVRSACRGVGACGICKIKILSDTTSNPSLAEEINLGQEEIEKNTRLACQVFPKNNLKIEIISCAPKSKFKSSTFANINSIYKELAYKDNFFPVKNPLGVAIDLGTTNISIVLFSLKTQKVIAERFVINPQNKYGDDVLTRLLAAVESENIAKELQQMIIDIIALGLIDISSREIIKLKDIVMLDIVGNTIMISLLSNKNQKKLISPRTWDKYVNVLIEDDSKYKKAWGVNENCKITQIKPIAGFIGSDLLAGIISTGLFNNKKPSLLVDFGTNSEIALWTGKEMIVSSAAGGPAFEGAGFKFGMPAISGAIYSAKCTNKNKWDFKILENCEVAGICGSGLIDIIANLIDMKILTKKGNFNLKEQKWIIPINKSKMYISKKDIDIIQRAKAAIVTGIRILCKEAGVKIDSLNKLYIGGTFGLHLNIDNAKKIGLIPNIENNKIKIIGNSALNGTMDIMQYSEAKEYVNKLSKNIKIVNMSKSSSFDFIYLENLYLQPMQEEENE